MCNTQSSHFSSCEIRNHSSFLALDRALDGLKLKGTPSRNTVAGSKSLRFRTLSSEVITWYEVLLLDFRCLLKASTDLLTAYDLHKFGSMFVDEWYLVWARGEKYLDLRATSHQAHIQVPESSHFGSSSILPRSTGEAGTDDIPPCQPMTWQYKTCA